MQHSGKYRCTVCGRENNNADRCTFCGAVAENAGSIPERPHEMAPQDATHGSGVNESDTYPVRDTLGCLGPSIPQQAVLPLAQARYAGFWIRVCAFLCDAILVRSILWVLFAIGVIGYGTGSAEGLFGDTFCRMVNVPWRSLTGPDFLVTLIYFTLFLGRRGQTPGKMLFGLKVTRKDGNPITYSHAMLRTMGYYINVLTFCIGFLWVGIDPRKQGLHDKIAETVELRLAPVRAGNI